MDTTNKLAEAAKRALRDAINVGWKVGQERGPQYMAQAAANIACDAIDALAGLPTAAERAGQRDATPSADQATQPAEAVRLSESRILQIANEWAKSPGWCDFERNDFIACVRAIVYESITHPAPASASEPASRIEHAYREGFNDAATFKDVETAWKLSTSTHLGASASVAGAEEARQRAIEALNKRLAARAYGQHAGFLGASDTVDIVIAALAASPVADGEAGGLAEEAKRLLAECSMKPDRRFSANKNRHHEARAELHTVIDQLAALARQAPAPKQRNVIEALERARPYVEVYAHDQEHGSRAAEIAQLIDTAMSSNPEDWLEEDAPAPLSQAVPEGFPLAELHTELTAGYEAAATISDGERLDWLQANSAEDVDNATVWACWPTEHDTLRAAIDAARAATSGSEGEGR